MNNNTGQINGTDQKFYVQTPLTRFDIADNIVSHKYCLANCMPFVILHSQTIFLYTYLDGTAYTPDLGLYYRML